jgi:hypothetical protein
MGRVCGKRHDGADDAGKKAHFPLLSCPARLPRALLMRRYAVPMRVEGPDLYDA